MKRRVNQVIKKKNDKTEQSKRRNIHSTSSEDGKAREERPFISKQDLMNRTLLSSTLCRTLDNLGILKDLSDTNQMTLF